MDWNLDQLDTFVAAAEAGSFSAAARRLGRAQSAVSTAIALLEASLGSALFDRSARNPVLTAAGSALLEEARELLRQCRHFENRALALGHDLPGRLTLALDEGLPYPPVLSLLGALGEAFPELELNQSHGSAKELADWLAAGQADLALAFRRTGDDAAFESEPVGAVPRILVAGVDHPLAKAGQVDRRHLARHRQLLMASRSLDDEESERISPRLWRVDSLYAIAEQVACGFGWAVLPLNVARYDPNVRVRLVELTARDIAFAPLEVRLYWRAGQGESLMLGWLRKYLARAVFATQ